jgi:hypothetical protein
MNAIKISDFHVQLVLILISILLLPFYGIGLPFFYFVLGGWQLLSYLINYAFKGKAFEKKVQYYSYSLIFIFFSFIFFLIFRDLMYFFLLFMVFAGLVLAVYYLIISYDVHKISSESEERKTIFRLK